MRLKTLAAFGAGYIYGMKAGAKRWDRLTELSEQVVTSPAVHGVINRVQESGNRVLQKVAGTSSTNSSYRTADEINLDR